MSSVRFWRAILRRSFSSARVCSSAITTLTGSKYERAATESSAACKLASVATADPGASLPDLPDFGACLLPALRWLSGRPWSLQSS